ncbi:MAG: Unknown protein [uncultured Sulfurovum sp.]|uniref:Lipoprotein n=1 Tax=uncultured Sulfurovum sp. TaxID=269237 RepID=A0A6S6SDQ8_9BACT|nr:MAG: Unknown protein [uncultured Sulfurovum sp.]
MISKKLWLGVVMSALLLTACTKQTTEQIEYPEDVTKPKLTQYELNVIAEKIYQNETSGDPKHLMFWSTNETFPSVGIGHFIWYPEGQPKIFDETFPAMIDYYVANKVQIPAWLHHARKTGAPWKDRETFERSRADNEFQQLKTLLLNTKALQTQFFFDRLHASIPEIVKYVAPQYRQHIVNNYNALAASKGGWYPLIDYINFKGKGIKATERYNNQGWGLLQVLQNMQPVQAGPFALMEFSRSAKQILERRVRNSPPAKNEMKWMAGWTKRTNGYATPIF